MVIDLSERRKQAGASIFDRQKRALASAVDRYAEGCADRVWAEAQKMRAVKGLDAALRMLGKVADDLRNQGRNES